MDPAVTALLLAAGLSSRMGATKQLLLLHDKTVIRHCLDALFDADIRDILVVIGLQGDAIMESLQHLPVGVVRNEVPNSDMAESIRTGLRTLESTQGGVLICLSDYPLVSANTIRALVRAFNNYPNNVIIPQNEGRRGHPTLFPLKLISGIFSGLTLRDIVHRNSKMIFTVDVNDEGILLDLDSKEDYRLIQTKLRDRPIGEKTQAENGT